MVSVTICVKGLDCLYWITCTQSLSVGQGLIGRLQPAGQTLPASWFLKTQFNWSPVMLICLHIVQGCFLLQQLSLVVSIYTVQTSRSKILYRNSLLIFGLKIRDTLARLCSLIVESEPIFDSSVMVTVREGELFLKGLCYAMLSHFSRVRLCATLQTPTRLPRPWDSPGKNTGVGCHFLLQCTKAKSEREVTQLCPTPSDPMDCSPPGSSVHGIFQARVLEWGAIAFSI